MGKKQIFCDIIPSNSLVSECTEPWEHWCGDTYLSAGWLISCVHICQSDSPIWDLLLLSNLNCIEQQENLEEIFRPNPDHFTPGLFCNVHTRGLKHQRIGDFLQCGKQQVEKNAKLNTLFIQLYATLTYFKSFDYHCRVVPIGTTQPTSQDALDADLKVQPERSFWMETPSPDFPFTGTGSADIRSVVMVRGSPFHIPASFPTFFPPLPLLKKANTVTSLGM